MSHDDAVRGLAGEAASLQRQIEGVEEDLRRLRGVRVNLTPFAPEGRAIVVGGEIYARSMSDVLAQVERERRRMDAVAAFAPEILRDEYEIRLYAGHQLRFAMRPYSGILGILNV
jgi:hypothetical protein